MVTSGTRAAAVKEGLRDVCSFIHHIFVEPALGRVLGTKILVKR